MKTILMVGGGIALTVLLAGCANAPLLFTSGVTVGVDISVNGASTNPVNLTVGYKQIDATLVPVTATDGANNIYPIRGCSGSAVGSEAAPGCATPSAGSVKHAALTGGALSSSSITLDPVALAQPVVLSSAPLGPGDQRNQGDTKNDALSVYSSFDTNISASAGSAANAGVNFGKVFATGIAAQNLSDDQLQFATLKGIALRYNATACVAELANALNAGGKSAVLTEAMVKVCAPPTPPPAPEK